MIELTNWYGLLGNNVLQILRAIYFAEKFGVPFVKIPEHHCLSTQFIEIESKIQKHHNSFTGTFFDLTEFNVENPDTLTLKNICKRYKKNVFNNFMTRDGGSLPSTGSITVRAHVRGGDVFGWRVHPSYLQPPLSYYRHVIRNFHYCELVAQDTRNPVAKYLKREKNVVEISKSEVDDFYALASCENLVFSASTFCYAAYLMSDVVKHIYIPDYYLRELPSGAWPNDVNVNIIELNGYLTNGTWRNTWKQRKKMI